MTRIQQRLKALKLTQKEFAHRAGVKATALNHSCRHGIFTIRLAERYAALLHCTPDELLEFSACKTKSADKSTGQAK